MADTKTRKTDPAVVVVFDTSVIRADTANSLLTSKVRRFLTGVAALEGISLSFYLPEVVMYERKFQMVEKGRGLLEAVRKVEELLQHNLNIKDKHISQGVQEVIDAQLKDHNLAVRPLDYDAVHWHDVMLAATNRRAPFERGDERDNKEKGFRDALIVETFTQVMSETLAENSNSYVVMVTNDNRMTEALETRIGERGNVRIISDIEELQGFINELVSEAGKDFVDRIKAKAGPYFFTQEDKTTLFFRMGIMERIQQKHKADLDWLPSGSYRRANDRWKIGSTTFAGEGKTRDILHWKTRILVPFTAYRIESQPTYESLLSPGGGASAIVGMPVLGDSASKTPQATLGSKLSALSLSASGLPWERQVEYPSATGQSIFEVTWRVAVTPDGELTEPHIDDIQLLEQALTRTGGAS